VSTVQSWQAAFAGGIDVSRFPARHAMALAEAMAYLMRSPTARRVVARIAARHQRIYLEWHPAHTKFLQHNPANLRVQWNPGLGLRDATGWLTPAVLLMHELGHAQFTAAERRAMANMERPQGFTSERHGVEEARVIATVEHAVARELNAALQRQGLPPLETARRCQRQLGRLVEVSGPLAADPATPDACEFEPVAVAELPQRHR
jgi:hypothetical protein